MGIINEYAERISELTRDIGLLAKQRNEARAEVERLTEQLRLAQIDNNNAETECAGWREEALAARKFFDVSDIRKMGRLATEYLDARAANEEGKKR